LEVTAVDVALVRGVPDSFARAIVSEPGSALDVDRARRQHAEYVETLRSAGYTIDEVAADDDHPDCVFIEDTAVVLGSVAVIARCRATSRRGETDPVRAALSDRFAIAMIEPPGTLDGGDVMQIGGSVFVGRSTRTNQQGIDQLAAIAARVDLEVIGVEVRQGLHLKSAVLPLDAETVLTTPNSVEEEKLRGLRVLSEALSERFRASALPMRDGRLLVTSTAPLTAKMLAGAGYHVAPIDVTELQAADGGLTCMSILFADSQ
jgi:dimethylargininase